MTVTLLRMAGAQETSAGSLDRDKVTAGQAFHLKVILSPAPSYQAHVATSFHYKHIEGIPDPPSPIQITCQAEDAVGDAAVDLSCPVPIDADSGVYMNGTSLRIWPAPGASRVRDIPLKVDDIEIVSVPDTNVYAGSAVATISLSQKQILVNAAAKVTFILDQLSTRADLHAAETKGFRQYLVSVADTARDELAKTRARYRDSLSKGQTEPIFLEDFDRQLQAFTMATTPTASIRRLDSRSAHLVLAQLSTSESVTVRPSPVDGSLGPYLSNLVSILTNLRDAYNVLADSRSDTFTISLRSSPPGATISYMRIGEPYQEYTKKTNVDEATFDYSMWTFKFTLGHCVVVKHPNPYIEKSPNLTVDMQNCSDR
ncbi:MAG TPA: hypothetical protein VGG45_09115 [Terracidiphilus sp.]